MQHTRIKQFVLLAGLLLTTAWCGANSTVLSNGYSHIQIKEAQVEGAPKGSSIQASIDGHTLTIVFTENLGQVAVEVTTASGVAVECLTLYTPNGLQMYVSLAGDYIVTFTLPNGDVYYGEFTVTN